MEKLNEEMFEQMKTDIKDYELYQLADSVEYNDYSLSVMYEKHNDSVLVHLENSQYEAINSYRTDEFMKMNFSDFQTALGETLYYGSQEKEQDMENNEALWQQPQRLVLAEVNPEVDRQGEITISDTADGKAVTFPLSVGSREGEQEFYERTPHIASYEDVQKEGKEFDFSATFYADGTLTVSMQERGTENTDKVFLSGKEEYNLRSEIFNAAKEMSFDMDKALGINTEQIMTLYQFNNMVLADQIEEIVCAAGEYDYKDGDVPFVAFKENGEPDREQTYYNIITALDNNPETVKKFLESLDTTLDKEDEIRDYLPDIIDRVNAVVYEANKEPALDFSNFSKEDYEKLVEAAKNHNLNSDEYVLQPISKEHSDYQIEISVKPLGESDWAIDSDLFVKSIEDMQPSIGYYASSLPSYEEFIASVDASFKDAMNEIAEYERTHQQEKAQEQPHTPLPENQKVLDGLEALGDGGFSSLMSKAGISDSTKYDKIDVVRPFVKEYLENADTPITLQEAVNAYKEQYEPANEWTLRKDELVMDSEDVFFQVEEENTTIVGTFIEPVYDTAPNVADYAQAVNHRLKVGDIVEIRSDGDVLVNNDPIKDHYGVSQHGGSFELKEVTGKGDKGISILDEMDAQKMLVEKGYAEPENKAQKTNVERD